MPNIVSQCPSFPQGKVVKLESKIEQDTVSYVWKINDFNKIPFVSKYPLYSPSFSVGKNNDSQWQITMTKHECFERENEDDYPSEGDNEYDSDEGDDQDFEDSKSLKSASTSGKSPNTSSKPTTVSAQSPNGSSKSTTVSSRSPNGSSKSTTASGQSPNGSSKTATISGKSSSPGGNIGMKSAAKSHSSSPDKVASGSTVTKVKSAKVKSSKKDRKKVQRLGLRLEQNDETSSWDIVKYLFVLKNSKEETLVTDKIEDPGEKGPRASYVYLKENRFNPDISLYDEKTLTITCEVTYTYVRSRQYEFKESEDRSAKQNLNVLQVLFHSKKFSDVVLVAKGGEFYAHKNVLHARAPKLSALFQDCDEKPKHKFDLQMSAAVANGLLHFIYGGKIPDDFDPIKCLDLHEAAISYGVYGMDKYCSKFFKDHLDNKVCKDCLGIEDQYDNCLESVKRLGITKVREIFDQKSCCHKSTQ